MRYVVMGLLAAVVGACGGDGGQDGPGPDAGNDPRPSAGVVGSAGGVVAVDSGPLAGTKVEVPPGALAAEVEITVGPASDLEATGYAPAGPAVAFGPSGTTFLAPVSVTVPYTADDPAGLVVFHASALLGVTLEPPVAIDPAAGTVTVRAYGFSEFQAMVPDAGGSSCTGQEVECDGVCVDTGSDTSHCGGCGNACAPGEICADRVCSSAPPEGAEVVATGNFRFIPVQRVVGDRLTWIRKEANAQTLQVFAVPVTGGVPQEVATLEYGWKPSEVSFVADGANLYVGASGYDGAPRRRGEIRRVPLDGSAPSVLAEDIYPDSLELAEGTLFWPENTPNGAWIKALSVEGGAPRAIHEALGANPDYRFLRATAGWVYFAQYLESTFWGDIVRVSTDGRFEVVKSHIGYPAVRHVDGDKVYYVENPNVVACNEATPARLHEYDGASGQTAEVLAACPEQFPALYHRDLAVGSQWVDGQALGFLWRLGPGAERVRFPALDDTVRPFALDDTHAYLSVANETMLVRVPYPAP